MLIPEVSSRRPILYSFRDVVALRTCVYLRQRVSLQRVRRALDTLADLGEQGHLSEYSLVAQGKSVVLVRDGDAGIDLVERPGNQVTVVMRDVLGAFDVYDRRVPDLYHPRQQVAVDPKIRGGHPVVGGTRVPYDLIAGLVRDGVNYEDIAGYYPAVSPAAARDAVEFADYVALYEAKNRSAA